MPPDFTPRSDFLRAVTARGQFHQCTDAAGLDAAAKGVTGYIGFDMTAPSLHVGSLTQIMLLRRLQQAGGKPIVLLGGGTTRVGDPSGKDESRQLLTEAQIATNTASIRSVFEKFLTFGDGKSDALMMDNADWLLKLNYIDFLRDIGRHMSINRMLTMDSVKLRLDREQNLTFLEFNYMILQAYDFVELKRRYNCELQMGGSDQWGNIVNGVELGRRMESFELFGLTQPLITTASGAKMGKTAEGAVWLNADMKSPYEYWQFWRNSEDADVGRFLKIFTDLPLAEITRTFAIDEPEMIPVAADRPPRLEVEAEARQAQFGGMRIAHATYSLSGPVGNLAMRGEMRGATGTSQMTLTVNGGITSEDELTVATVEAQGRINGATLATRTPARFAFTPDGLDATASVTSGAGAADFAWRGDSRRFAASARFNQAALSPLAAVIGRDVDDPALGQALERPLRQELLLEPAEADERCQVTFGVDEIAHRRAMARGEAHISVRKVERRHLGLRLERDAGIAVRGDRDDGPLRDEDIRHHRPASVEGRHLAQRFAQEALAVDGAIAAARRVQVDAMGFAEPNLHPGPRLGRRALAVDGDLDGVGGDKAVVTEPGGRRGLRPTDPELLHRAQTVEPVALQHPVVPERDGPRGLPIGEQVLQLALGGARIDAPQARHAVSPSPPWPTRVQP